MPNQQLRFGLFADRCKVRDVGEKNDHIPADTAQRVGKHSRVLQNLVHQIPRDVAFQRVSRAHSLDPLQRKIKTKREQAAEQKHSDCRNSQDEQASPVVEQPRHSKIRRRQGEQRNQTNQRSSWEAHQSPRERARATNQGVTSSRRRCPQKLMLHSRSNCVQVQRRPGRVRPQRPLLLLPAALVVHDQVIERRLEEVAELGRPHVDARFV